MDQPTLQDVLDEFTTGLSDMVKTMERGTDAKDEIANTLSEMLKAMKGAVKDKTSPDAIVQALRGIRITAPDVNVTVAAPVVHNHIQGAPVQLLERAPRDIDIHHQYNKHGEITVSQVRFVPVNK